MMDMAGRLRAGRGFGKSETEASAAVFRQLKERGHSDGPPPTVSDGAGRHPGGDAGNFQKSS